MRSPNQAVRHRSGGKAARTGQLREPLSEKSCLTSSEDIIPMCELDWAEIAKILISIWVATVATIALKTWKRQSKAQRQIDLLDELTNAIHEFIETMSAPTEVLHFIQIGIESHKGTWGLRSDVENPEAVAYIEKHGKEDSKRLLEYLNLSAPALTRIRSLSAKGQVLGFMNFQECQNACLMLARQHDRIQATCFIIGSTSLYWPNPEVQKSLNALVQIDPVEIKTELGAQNIKYLEFVKENYEKIYK